MASWHSDFAVGDWHVSPKLNRISKGDQTVGVKHKSMAVLVFLADAEGEVLTRDEILDGVWPGMEITDDVLTQAIHELRHAFDDDAKRPRYIETIPRVGIRLIAKTTVAEEDPRSSDTVSVAQPSRRYLLPTFAAIVVSAILWAVVDRQSVEREPVITVRDSVSIAVLPFVNRSNIADDAFFVDGMHDDLLTLLSRLSSVDKVISRTSTEQYRDTAKPIPQIGQELRVASILEGAVQRSGSQVRINVQLIDTETEHILWADTYDRDLNVENLFAIQSEMTRAIVAALHGVLSEQEDEALNIMPTNSLDAYAEYVLGRHEMAKRTGAAISRANAHFQTAVELDPNYALAYVSLADTYMLMSEYQGTETTLEDIIEPAEAAIAEALSIDPLSGEAYTSLGGLRQYQFQDEEAEKYYLKAIEYSPGYAMAYLWYFSVLQQEGRYEEALEQVIKAAELDPLSSAVTNHLAEMYLRVGRHQEAESTLLDGLERDPDFPGYYRTTSWMKAVAGRLGEALMWAQTATKLNPTNLWDRFFECNLYADIGKELSATKCYAGFEERFPEAVISYIPLLYCSRSQFETALDLMRGWEQSAQGKGKYLGMLRTLSWHYVACGDPGSARTILEDIEPDLFGDGDIAVEPNEMSSAHAMVAAAYSLYVDGEMDRANYLFDQALDAMQSMRRTRLYGYAVLDVFIHVTRGDKELAIQALRDAIDSGWDTGWWELRSSLYASMQDNPEWIELLAEKEEDVRQQRQWFEEHKNDPLF